MKTNEEIIYELTGSLQRLINAAKPHCSLTSILNMRVKEAEEMLTQLRETFNPLTTK